MYAFCIKVSSDLFLNADFGDKKRQRPNVGCHCEDKPEKEIWREGGTGVPMSNFTCLKIMSSADSVIT